MDAFTEETLINLKKERDIATEINRLAAQLNYKIYQARLLGLETKIETINMEEMGSPPKSKYFLIKLYKCIL